MIPMNQETAIQVSIEIAKIMCSVRGDKFPINANSANEIANFIETLENRFTCKTSDNC